MEDHPQSARPVRLKMHVVVNGGRRAEADQEAEFPDGRWVAFCGGVGLDGVDDLSLTAGHEDLPGEQVFLEVLYQTGVW